MHGNTFSLPTQHTLTLGQDPVAFWRLGSSVTLIKKPMVSVCRCERHWEFYTVSTCLFLSMLHWCAVSLQIQKFPLEGVLHHLWLWNAIGSCDRLRHDNVQEYIFEFDFSAIKTLWFTSYKDIRIKISHGFRRLGMQCHLFVILLYCFFLFRSGWGWGKVLQ